MLDNLSERFRDCGLQRERRLFTAERDGQPIMTALADTSSLGVNFSYLLNAFRIVELQGDLTAEVRREAFHRLLRALCAYYRAMGRDFLVGLGLPGQRAVFLELGYEPLKQYLCLAGSVRLDGEAAQRHLDGYYRSRLPPEKESL
jgi:hypothetical protein